jgi:hypothetical protein
MGLNDRIRVLIFGLSYHGRAVYRLLDRGLYDIVGFLDNDIKKSGEMFGNSMVYHARDINFINFDIVIVAGRNIDDMNRQLTRDFFIAKEKIIVMNRSDLLIKGNILNSREDVLKDMLFRLKNLVKNKSINYWVIKSSLLALKRGEKFAEFSDVDICIMSEQAHLFIDDLNKVFPMYDVKVERYYSSSKYWKKGSISSILITEKVDPVISEPALIDISVLNKHDNKVFIKSLHNTVTILPFSHFNGASVITRYNLEFSVPKDAEEYLRLIYGNEWKISVDRWQNKYYGSVKWK